MKGGWRSSPDRRRGLAWKIGRFGLTQRGKGRTSSQAFAGSRKEGKEHFLIDKIKKKGISGNRGRRLILEGEGGSNRPR